MTIKSRFVQFLKDKFPEGDNSAFDELVADTLLSPFSVTLPQTTLEKIQAEIKMYFELRLWTANRYIDDYKAKDLKVPPNYAVCNSFDFNINEEGNPKLIEINTNAAFFALGLQMYEFWKKKPSPQFTDADLVETFRREAALLGLQDFAISIMDHKPQDQRLYIEFLIYQRIFSQAGIESQIVDSNDYEKISKAKFIYNRYTDFYLQEPESLKLRGLFNDGKVCFSPSPWEYFLLADKKRMQDWSEQNEVPLPSSLLKIYDLGIEDREKIWAARKNLFFKPKNSFGSKQAYRGSSISHKTFDEFYGGDFIAQEFVSPSEIDVVYEGVPQKMKYDLRCYTYKDELQLVIARIYQGQTTNLRTPGGGFAMVHFI